jgi:hypothetical protein
MALNPLTLNVNSGIVGRPFSATISGLNAGSTLQVLSHDGTQGFYVVNSQVLNDRLPYATNTLRLRETLAGTGTRDSVLTILADGIALGDSGLPPALAALGVGYPIPASSLDMTGVNDNSAIVLAAFVLSANGVVELPATNPATQAIRLTNLVIPSGCKLVGSGKLVMDRSTFAWSGLGTLIKGNISLTGAVGSGLADLTVDAYATGLSAVVLKSDATKNIRISRIATSANDHGILCEKNCNTGNTATDALGANYNNIIIEDTECYRGPNGIAVKMRHVLIDRCICYDITVQAYPIVSDCINGATTYSRAQDVTMRDCDAIGCSGVLHIYSRDNFSPTGADGVQPAKNIKWFGGRIAGATGSHGAEIGDPTVNDATIQRIPSQDVWIIGADIRDNAQVGIFFEDVNGGGYTGCTFGNNGTAGGGNAGVGVLATNRGSATNVTHGPCIAESGSVGLETGLKSYQSATTLASAMRGITNHIYLASSSVAFTLPTPQIGDEYKFHVDATTGMTIASAIPATNPIRNGASIATANIASTATGSTLTLKALPNVSNVLQWVVTAITGTWAIT